jgi:hypothetical protein
LSRRIDLLVGIDSAEGAVIPSALCRKVSGRVLSASLFAAETIVWSAALGPAILLRAMESPRSLFFANGAASVVALVFGIPATRYFGLRGVIWSMVLANVLYVVVAFIMLGRKVSTLTTPEPLFEMPLPVEESAY